MLSIVPRKSRIPVAEGEGRQLPLDAGHIRRHRRCPTLLCCLLATLVLRAEQPPASLEAALARVPDEAAIGVVVIEVGTGQTVFAHRADERLPLASVTKLLVTAAALSELGPDYRFRTRILRSGPIAADGSIRDLCVVGSGDPCLDEHFTEETPDEIFTGWIDRLRRAGVRNIAGDLVIDTSLFAGPIRPASYPQDHANLQKWYSAPASAFAWNDNCLEVRVVPGPNAGGPAVVQVRPRSPRMRIVNKTTTVARRKRSPLIAGRAPTANTISVSGRYAKATSWYPLAIHSDPALLAGDHFSGLLAEHGLPIGGEVRIGTLPDGEELFVHESPLLPALRILNQRSQNFYGEQILRVIGHHRAGTGSIADGCRAVEAILGEQLGLDPADFRLLDGSGLSHGNLASARQVARLLAVMAADEELHEHFHDSLKEKWWGTVRCRVKTGTLSIARTLAGYIPGPDDKRYAFAILLHRDEAATIAWAIRAREWIFRKLVDRWGR